MARLLRVVAANVPHHLTQRGNSRQYVPERDEDRAVYLKLLRENIQTYSVALLGYCLMSNHVHLIAVPSLKDGLALACKNAHCRYAAYWNATRGASGHEWQGRFYSCPLHETHLWAALRYTELNAVRAGLVSEPESWPWSSAAWHCGKAEDNPPMHAHGKAARECRLRFRTGKTTGRCLVPQRRGRMKDERVDPRQASLSSGPLS